jgi:corrinoid protein of di/trimethylamine methyltransferase
MSDILQELNSEVQKGQTERVKEIVQKGLDQGLVPMEILEKGLRLAMEEIGRKFESLEIFLPEMMGAADAMTAGVAILQPHLESSGQDTQKGLIVLGTVEGDVHEIGKNIVSIMLKCAGYKVEDIGYDVPVLTFVDKVKDLDPDILGMSALMTSTMVHMPRVIIALQERDLRKVVKVVVGGAPVLPEWAEEIGADGYGENAADAIRQVKELLK